MSNNPKHPLFWVAPVLFLAALFFPFSSQAPFGLVGRGDDAPATARILMGGDMLFDRSIRAAVDAHGGDFVFSCIDPVLKNADVVVANLEGPITDNLSISLGSLPESPENYTFTFPPSTAALLFAHNIRLVNIGNNHILNYGYEGEAATKYYLEKAGVGYFGQPAMAGDLIEDSVAYESVRGVKLAFINYNEFAPPGAAEGADIVATTIAQIKKARANNFIPVVYTHWGVEYASTSPGYVQVLAHAFVDAGAEIVVGSHPHVVEESEVYKNKYIYYSLGNFIFDQYFSDEVQRGLLLSLLVAPQGVVSITEIPVVLNRDRRTCPV